MGGVGKDGQARAGHDVRQIAQPGNHDKEDNMNLRLLNDEEGYYWIDLETGFISQSFGLKQDAKIAQEAGLLIFRPIVS